MTERPTAPSQRSGVGGILATYLERPTGGQTGSVGRAASATKAFLAFSLVLTGAYTIFFAMYDASAFAANIISGTVSVILFGVGLGFVTRGHQLTAAVIAVSVGTAQVAFTTTYVGWIAGFQLYLIAGGQLVFMLFTDRQQMLRAAYVAVAIGAFFYCQLIVPEKGLVESFSAKANGVMFSINASVALLLVYLLAAAGHAGAARARAQADGAAARAEFLANTDELTGLSNRRPVVKRLEKLSSTAPYIVAIADLDHFKRLNDTYGHECGDRVLAAVGHRLRDSVRSVDTVGRWGGEEFIVVMEQSTLADATEVVERLRARIAEPVPCTGHSHSITVSVGLTDAQPDGTAARALQRADAALYEAKAAGRNAVHVVPGPPPAPGAPPPPRRRRS